MTTTQELATFVTSVDTAMFTDDTVEELKKRVLDSVGIGDAGDGDESVVGDGSDDGDGDVVVESPPGDGGPLIYCRTKVLIISLAPWGARKVSTVSSDSIQPAKMRTTMTAGTRRAEPRIHIGWQRRCKGFVQSEIGL